MSIATDEAEKKYPAPTDADDPMYKYVEAIAGYPAAKRQGYVAGRTAEPTAVEVEEAAYALWKTEVNMASLNPTESEYTGAWGKLSIQQRDMYRSKAVMMLEEARKAVSE